MRCNAAPYFFCNCKEEMFMLNASAYFPMQNVHIEDLSKKGSPSVYFIYFTYKIYNWQLKQECFFMVILIQFNVEKCQHEAGDWDFFDI